MAITQFFAPEITRTPFRVRKMVTFQFAKISKIPLSYGFLTCNMMTRRKPGARK